MTHTETLIGAYLMSNLEILFVALVTALALRAVVRSFGRDE